MISTRVLVLNSILLISVLTGACSSQPPVPVNKYYHLQEANNSGVTAQSKISGSVLVMRPRARGIYNDRAMLFADKATSLEINRYHYHLWALPPAEMVQEHARLFLSKAAIADKVQSDSRKSDSTAQIEIDIRRFEHVRSSNGGAAKVSLRIRVERNNKIHVNDYEEVIDVSEANMHSVVVAFSKALDRVFTSFVKQLK